MSNFADDIIEAAKGEPIEAIVITSDGWYQQVKSVPDGVMGKVMTWDEARPLLAYEYHSGFGGQECHNFYAWTPTRVLFVHEYDGSTYVRSVPRNPTAGVGDDA